MDFSLTEEQAAFGGLVTDVLTRECGPDVVRAGWPDGDQATVVDLWRLLGDTGLFAMMVDESAGGLALDAGFIVPGLQPVGAAAVPGPVTDTVTIAAPVLAAAGHERIDDVLSGDAMVACGVGRAGPIPYATIADIVLLDDGQRVTAHDFDTLEVAPVASIDGARHAATVVTTTPGVEVSDGRHRDELVRKATLGVAAELLGLGERLLAMTVDYVAEREQFGVPVGSFQAVKHQLADVRLALSFAAPLALRAGWSLANDAKDAGWAVASAKAAASDAAHLAATTTLQCHGAIAYTTEYDWHLYAKRAWALSVDRGDSTQHRLAVADALDLPQAV